MTAVNQGDANQILRSFQTEYPKRKIIGVSTTMATAFPQLWFMTITYEVDI